MADKEIHLPFDKNVNFRCFGDKFSRLTLTTFKYSIPTPWSDKKFLLIRHTSDLRNQNISRLLVLAATNLDQVRFFCVTALKWAWLKLLVNVNTRGCIQVRKKKFEHELYLKGKVKGLLHILRQFPLNRTKIVMEFCRLMQIHKLAELPQLRRGERAVFGPWLPPFCADHMITSPALARLLQPKTADHN